MSGQAFRSAQVTALRDESAMPDALNDQIYQDLRWKLITGVYNPGDPISIRSVADEAGVSMMPVREALKRLESERALVASARRSFRVQALTARDVADLFFVRSHLEGLATERAVPKLTSAQIRRLGELAAQMNEYVEARDINAYLSNNYTFHFTIYLATGIAELCAIIENLWVQTGPSLANGLRQQQPDEEWKTTHREIVDAIAARDTGAARQLMEKDIRWGMSLYESLAGAPADGT